MIQNDQKIRYIAVFLIAPTVILKGINYNDYIIIVIGMGLLFVDLYSLLYRKPIEY